MLLTDTIFLKTCRKRRYGKRVEWLRANPPKPKAKKSGVIKEPVVLADRNYYRMYKYRKGHEFCEICKIKRPVCTHHVVPFSEGGDESDNNYMALCKDCHTTLHPDMNNFMESNNYEFNRRKRQI